ncbi:RDD family protein [Cellulosimicrobium marinum]|uniref:RDD family protein n=1 Tax=Cellulosimicrobium marinum TaxID=1638992 RepID=UPI001E5196CC|nr:RDD family protein [Cellulosimicrobium marinum]MCB7137218.1 RDD family protein [Cellulosimicrobium marinum]
MRDGILIGEGVVLDARPASFISRALGAIIDVVTIGALLWAFLLVTAGTMSVVEPDLATAAVIVIMVVVMVVVPTTVETLSRGRSLGKLALGIRVVRDDGGPVRFRHAFLRALVGVGELWLTLGSVALIASLTNDKGKRLGDMAAGTYAIRVRGGRPTLAPLVMPPHLAAWAGHADMRRLPDGLALAARQFLSRADRLHPASRERLGRQLAGQVERFVAPGPPPGTHPELFLLAVLSERRDRDWVTARRAQVLAAEQAETLHRLPYSVPDPSR